MFFDEDEWSWSGRTDPVLHIELRRVACLLVVAPLSANTMAKFANGLCDNLLTCVFRAWNKAAVFAPAMNTFMYEHPLTSKQIRVLAEELGVVVLRTLFKKLMCNEEGLGAMVTVEEIMATLDEKKLLI